MPKCEGCLTRKDAENYIRMFTGHLATEAVKEKIDPDRYAKAAEKAVSCCRCIKRFTDA
jgi:hypothetical protein